MDVKNNNLVADINSVPENLKKQYTEIPEHLHNEAKELLDGASDTYLKPKHNSKLGLWVKDERKKRRAKEKMAKASRKKNRNK